MYRVLRKRRFQQRVLKFNKAPKKEESLTGTELLVLGGGVLAVTPVIVVVIHGWFDMVFSIFD